MVQYEILKSLLHTELVKVIRVAPFQRGLGGFDYRLAYSVANGKRLARMTKHERGEKMLK